MPVHDGASLMPPSLGVPVYQQVIGLATLLDEPRVRGHASNAMDNFCFDVTLGYRRIERPRRPR
ncbi:MAG TPA: hypothetical protein VMU94_21755 [Streptosporangiaceae bacterium]|nr:hypothetical protein [Streptosporangiaceae bacterium]